MSTQVWTARPSYLRLGIYVVRSCTSNLPLVICQLFVPINIKDTHWYLAVVNAAEHNIQVLDSYGTLFGREELNNTVSFCYVCSFFY
jgi:Ulp1 family protease